MPVQNNAEAVTAPDPVPSLATPDSAPEFAGLPESAPALELSTVSVRYGGSSGTTALEDLNLRVDHGEHVAVVGPSGCGKSTLLALVAGLIEPTSGTARVDVEVALMPQHDLLVPWRDALGNAALALEAQGVSRREALRRAAPLFPRFGLDGFERARTWELSGGMRQRVAFLRTALTGRPLFALDEPFGALDSITRGQMQQWLLAALADTPRALLLVTHDIDEALTLAERVVFLSPRPGRIIGQLQTGRPQTVERTDWVTSPEFAALKAEALAVLG